MSVGGWWMGGGWRWGGESKKMISAQKVGAANYPAISSTSFISVFNHISVSINLLKIILYYQVLKSEGALIVKL